MPYLCNGTKECHTHENCYKNGGECEHTFDPKYARIDDQTKNFGRKQIRTKNKVCYRGEER